MNLSSSMAMLGRFGLPALRADVEARRGQQFLGCRIGWWVNDLSVDPPLDHLGPADVRGVLNASFQVRQPLLLETAMIQIAAYAESIISIQAMLGERFDLR